MSRDESDTSSIIPPWVNREFVEKVFKNGSEGTLLKVKSFESEYACDEGMSYSSYIFRIVATVTSGESATCEKRSFILKYSPVDWETEDADEEDVPLEPESVVLGEVMAEVERLLKGAEGEAWQPVAPVCYLREFSEHLFKAVATTLRAHEGYESYAVKYEQLAEKFTNAFFNYWRSGEFRLPVVLHGDCWKYNFMFKYENENVTGVRLVDFQGSMVHSGAADLQHFLYRNAGVEVLSEHVDTLLVALLRRLGMADEADSYPLEALREDVAAALYCSALSLMSLTSHQRSHHWGAFFSMTDTSQQLLQDAFTNPHYVSCLKYLVPAFDKKGLL